MKMTPMDIQQQQFRSSFSGLDRTEVRQFLQLVSETVTELSLENSELKTEVRRMQQTLDEFGQTENLLKQAMITAQKAVEDVREQTKKEADIIISEAELRAEKLLHHAHIRLSSILDDIQQLKSQKIRVIEDLRSLLRTHMELLQLHDDKQQQEPDEASLKVLERVRVPAPPIPLMAEDLDAVG